MWFLVDELIEQSVFHGTHREVWEKFRSLEPSDQAHHHVEPEFLPLIKGSKREAPVERADPDYTAGVKRCIRDHATRTARQQIRKELRQYIFGGYASVRCEE
jgi:hypothetical protein